MKDADQQERRERWKKRRVEIAEVQKAGYLVRLLNGGLQVSIRTAAVRTGLSYWPSTGKWHNERTDKRGRLADDKLLMVREQLV